MSTFILISCYKPLCIPPALQDLVGKNLTYISQLDGLTFELYSTSVLPRLLEQVSLQQPGCRRLLLSYLFGMWL